MKLSIAWIFDHIQADWRQHDIPALIARLSATTAEIDQVKELIFDFYTFSLAQVTKVSAESITLYSQEWKKEFSLKPFQTEQYVIDQIFLVIKDAKAYRFATSIDMGSEKEFVLPALSCPQELIAGAWKDQCDRYDYVLSLDNKAVTHRPDLWGHRGFAREVAALLGVPLRAEDVFLASKPIKHFDKESIPSSHNPLKIRIESPSCNRLAGLSIQSIHNSPSSLFQALRIMRIDARVIDAIVDATNYAMFDWGHPMHAFDAKKIDDATLIAQQARTGEKLTVLDGETLELSAADCIISDGHKALALAGIMGGRESGVSKNSTSIIIEAAHFDATAIRLTAARYKKRTEASTRFEKTLDPHQNTQVLLRFLKLLDEQKIMYQSSDAISSVGALSPEKVITVTHDFIQRRLGVVVDERKVARILQALGFGVQYDKSSGLYTVVVPSYRASKDVAIKEDIVDEVGRSIGYNSIPSITPTRPMNPIDHSSIYTLRALKQQCAYGLKMHEVYNYAFFDEEFMQKIGLAIDSVAVVNPVSENWKQLVTSLVPHLLKNIQSAAIGIEAVRFFEVGTIWEKKHDQLTEKQSLAVALYAKNGISFYEGKELIQQLFDVVRMSVQWRKPSQVPAWFDPFQTAELVSGDTHIGYVGKIDPKLSMRLVDGDICIAELHLDALINREKIKTKFKPLAKYQPVSLDVSMLLPYTVTADAISAVITGVDARISAVSIVDFFEKPEWGNRRSLTMRFVIIDEQKTLLKEDIDGVHAAVIKAVKAHGAEVR